MLTKTQVKVLAVFVSRITESFSIRQLAAIISSPYPLAHRAATGLVEAGMLRKDRQKRLLLDYRSNPAVLAYVEHLRSSTHGVKQEAAVGFPIVAAFAAAGEQGDVVVIAADAAARAAAMQGTAAGRVIPLTPEEAAAMLASRNDNVMNALLNDHLLLAGAEDFYRLLAAARR